MEAELGVLFDDHHDLFERRVAGAFAETIDGTFDLPGAVADAGDGIGCGQTEIVMAMAGDDGFIDVGHFVLQPGDLFAVLVGKAVARGIGDVHNSRSSCNYRFNNPSKVIIVSATSVFSVELYVVDQVSGPFDGPGGALQYLLMRRIELALNVRVAGSDAGVDAGATCGFQSGGSRFNVLLDGAAQTTDGSIPDDTCYLFHGMEIARTGDREACFYDIDAKRLELQGQFDLFLGIELTTGYLLAVAERSVEDEDFLVGH